MSDKFNSWDIYFLQQCFQIARKSKDPSTKVGALIVRPNHTVASQGFNGFPMSMNDDSSLYEDRTTKYARIIHGEMNALIFSREPVVGYTLYTSPFMPCERCALHLIQAGIRRFVFPEPTPQQLERWSSAFQTSFEYMAEANREWTSIPLELVHES